MRTQPVLSAGSLASDTVYSSVNGEKLGNVKDIMIDTENGRVAYAVLSFGGFLGMGDKLFAVPWSTLTVDTANERLLADIREEHLENAEGFDKDNWPDFANPAYRDRVYDTWKADKYWG